MKKSIDYKKLIINPENYRFDPVDTQDQAIDLMLEEKGSEIFNLAKHILEHGLDNAKDFRLIKKEKGKFLVLDGNRRITAIKCLHDISLIKDNSLKKKFSNLKIDKSKLPQKVNAFIYSSEAVAAKWIKLDHTGKNDGAGQDSWGAAEVDRFEYKFEGKLSPAMQAVMLVEREKNKKFDTRKLKVSTINRIFSNPEARSYIGIDIKDKKINFTTSKKEAVERIDKLFNKIIDDNVKVDVVYTKEKTAVFMKDIFPSKPKQIEIPILNKETDNSNGIKKTQRTKLNSVTFFGRNLCLKKGDTNDIYRDITDLFNFYQNNKTILSKSFCSLIRMSLRLIVESATDKKIDDYVNSNFDNGKKKLLADEKTTLSNNSVTQNSLIKLLHTGAHKYSASSNIEQTIAMSIIIGAMLEITHSKK
ncbi:MAG: hypothetical protein WC662_00140 [Candidatus Paceibacterota bacterium]|jgi:hypothetical protein